MNGIRKLLSMAKRFTWSELQTTDSNTGSLTMAGWIQRIQPMMWRLNFCDWGTHLLYFILRGVAGNGKPFFFNSWFPLDTDDIASYTLVIIMQINRRKMASEEKRLARLRRMLHSLATRVPKIILTRVDWTFPALKNQASVKVSATAHFNKDVNAEELLCERSAELPELYEERDAHTCEICKKSFSRRNNLSEHASGSRRETMSRCDMCVTSLTPKCSAVQRFSGHACNVCNRRFIGRANLEKHIRVHTGERPFSCEVCKKRFSQLHNLYRHLRMHSGERPFSCEVCKKGFTQLHNLKRHLRMHTGERPFCCEVCKKAFAWNSILKRHLKLHNGERPFSCEVCGKMFKQRHHLNRHLRVHSGERPFSCEVCEKTFTQRSNLKNHLRVHNGERPFSCKVCKKRFARLSNLNTHLRIHSGQRPFPCKLCKKIFTRRFILNMHLKKHSAEQASSCDVEGNVHS